MAGIIGQAIANIGNTFGNYMLQSARDDEREQERREREDLRRREREEDRKWREEQDAKYRRTAEQQGASRSSGPRELTDDEQAAMAGMDRPTYDALWKSVKTGDRSSFKRGVEREVDVPDPDNPDYNSTRQKQVVQDYPPGFEAEYQAKVSKLAEIRKISVYNKDYDDVKRGERTGQQINASNAAIARPEAAGVIGQGMAAGEGKGAYKVQGNTKINEFTGEATSTEVGESIEARNRRGPVAKPVNVKDVPYEKLTAQAETLRKAINEASGDRKKSLETQFDEVMAELKRRRESTSAPGAPAPRPGAAPTGQKSYSNLWK